MTEFTLQTDGLEERQFEAGEVILAEGERSPEVFVLKSGKVKVSTDGREICRVDQTNTILGEIAILLDRPHTATVVAADDCTFYVIPDFMKQTEKDPRLGVHVAQGLANRLIDMNTNFVDIRSELEQIKNSLPADSHAGSLHKIIIKMDEFWGKTVF